MGRMLDALKRLDEDGALGLPPPLFDDEPASEPAAEPASCQISDAPAAVANEPTPGDVALGVFCQAAASSETITFPELASPGETTAEAVGETTDEAANEPFDVWTPPAELAAPTQAPSATVPPARPKPASRGETPLLDPRFASVADAILATLAGGRHAAILFASTPDSLASGGQLCPLYSLLASRLDGPALAVDCDFRRPTLASRFGLRAKAEWPDLLTGRTPWQEALVTDPSGLNVLSGENPGGATPRPIELLGLVGELRDQFRLVLLDAAPSSDDELAELAEWSDGVYLLAWADATPRGSVHRAIETVRRQGGTALGCILLDAA